MNCYACDAELIPDNACPDTTYQFDNVLWICFHGGYGMFVDNLEATLPNNTNERWLTNEAGDEYLTTTDESGRVHAVDNPDWKPAYHEERVLYPPADYEAVICHDCAHKLCEDNPWVERLLNARNSHTHRTSWVEAHPEHPDHHDTTR